MPDETGLDAIMGGFAQFAGGIEALAPQVTEATHTMTQEQTTVSLPHLNGALPGDVASVEFWVSIQQVELASPEDLLLSRYVPSGKGFESFQQAVAALGDGVPALPVLPAQRNIQTQGQSLPMFLVLDNPPLYYALIALKRKRIKVTFANNARPGSFLLYSMAQHGGQLYQAPSIIEICKAAKRLNQYYGFTLDEIAAQQAMNREDNTPPSRNTVHYQILVASLPDSVHQRIETGVLLYTQAKNIAEAYLDDPQMCEWLAMIAHGMNVAKLDNHIKRIQAGLETLEPGPDGEVRIIPRDQAIALVDDRSLRGQEIIGYGSTMIARPATIRKEASRFQVSVIPAASPDKIAVSSRSLDELTEWLTSRRTNTPVKEIEAVLLGFLEAVRLAARTQGLVNNQGVLAPMIDANDSAVEA